jgi:aryl-alcohol dehydrogenase-like predicted oxidoreductase
MRRIANQTDRRFHQGGIMELRQLGHTDIHMSPIIMGTWQAGKAMWTDIDDNETRKGMRAALDTGINTFDTANIYAGGRSERALGRWFNLSLIHI